MSFHPSTLIEPVWRAALRAVDVVFPALCAACGAETGTGGTLCAACWRDTAFISGPVCDGCGRETPGPAEPGFRCDHCVADPPGWDRARAVFHYQGAGRRLVLALKHGDRLDTVPMLGGWLARAAGPLILQADFVAPVPLHWTRLFARRANQSAELARAACRAAGRRGAYAPMLLRRPRRTASQGTLGRDARHANLAGALAVAPGARIDGARVLVIDDVRTTGATLGAAAAVLRAAGAARVEVAVLALAAPIALPVLPEEEERA